MADLFAAAGLDEGAPRPLADKLRPTSLSEVVGQEKLLGKGGILSRMVDQGRITAEEARQCLPKATKPELSSRPEATTGQI